MKMNGHALRRSTEEFQDPVPDFTNVFIDIDPSTTYLHLPLIVFSTVIFAACHRARFLFCLSVLISNMPAKKRQGSDKGGYIFFQTRQWGLSCFSTMGKGANGEWIRREHCFRSYLAAPAPTTAMPHYAFNCYDRDFVCGKLRHHDTRPSIFFGNFTEAHGQIVALLIVFLFVNM